MKGIKSIQDNYGTFTSFRFSYLADYKRGYECDEDFTDYLLKNGNEPIMQVIRKCIK